MKDRDAATMLRNIARMYDEMAERGARRSSPSMGEACMATSASGRINTAPAIAPTDRPRAAGPRAAPMPSQFTAARRISPQYSRPRQPRDKLRH
jgi:hypothetical protein